VVAFEKSKNEDKIKTSSLY